MNKKVVVAVDSMKGSLSAHEFAAVCGSALRGMTAGCECVEIPLADGGEGTVDVVSASSGYSMVECRVANPLGNPVVARYAISEDGLTAVIEMAQAAGLTLVPDVLRNPMLASTYGVGEMILDAAHRGCRTIYTGLGGSATNDAGMGMLRALGYVFRDYSGRELEGNGASLLRVASIDGHLRNPLLEKIRFVAACDVSNPLSGPDGAAFVFAPQKGATPEMVGALDKGLRNFGRVVYAQYGIDMQSVAGSGAAGGLGGAFAAFLKSGMMPGIEMVMEAVDFDGKIEGTDLIITGEGCLDSQSLMGKTVSGVLRHAKEKGVDVIGIGGSVRDAGKLKEAGFKEVYTLMKEGQTLEEAMQFDTAKRNIADTMAEIARSPYFKKKYE